MSQAQVDGSVKVGFSGYQGDIHCRTDAGLGVLEQLNMSFGLGARFALSEALGLRAEGSYFHLSADETLFEDVGHRNRGWSFDNKFIEVAAMLDYEFMRKNRRNAGGKFQRTLTPLVFGGVGLMFDNADVNFRNANPSGLSEDVEKTGKARFALPVGLGLKYYITERVALALETGIRLPVSDYYDGISQTASSDQKDAYGFGGLKGYFSLAGKTDADQDGIADDDDACPNVFGIAAMNGCPDSDMDGVIDSRDNCPNEAGSPSLAGCPDSDGDGIANKMDDCPRVKGLAALNGCPDSDGDGITDKSDDCPETAGIAALNGCPDSDADGVADAKDKCPNEAGLLSNDGCPPADKDNDGIVDAEDACPNAAGSKATAGCPDRDGDGVADKDDNCPNRAGVAPSGCPRVTTSTPARSVETDKGIITERLNLVTKNLRFPSGSSNLDGAAVASLTEVLTLLRTYPSLRININGYTDSQGSEIANQQLSQSRARACYNYLVRQGIEASRLRARGYGETNPIASNRTAEGRYLNRRVEFIIVQ